MTFSWNCRTVCIKPTKLRDHTISTPIISFSIKGMFGHEASRAANPDMPGFAALLYIFAYIMLHEDDVGIV